MIADEWQMLCPLWNGYVTTLEWIIAMKKWRTSLENNLRICLNMSFLFGKRGLISECVYAIQASWKDMVLATHLRPTFLLNVMFLQNPLRKSNDKHGEQKFYFGRLRSPG